jgi:hypothetical protein
VKKLVPVSIEIHPDEIVLSVLYPAGVTEDLAAISQLGILSIPIHAIPEEGMYGEFLEDFQVLAEAVERIYRVTAAESDDIMEEFQNDSNGE